MPRLLPERVRPWLLAAAVVAVSLGGAAWLSDPAPDATTGQGQPIRDWQKHPAVVEVDTPHDVYAVGDPHGDYERLLTVLTAAKVIAGDPGPPQKVRWTGGKAVLVCTGDLIDKGNQGLRVIALFRALEPAARE